MVDEAPLPDWSRHSPYSDPGEAADRLIGVPTDLPGLSAVARNLIVHYRASGFPLPEETRSDIDLRWLERQLQTDRARHPEPLDEPREPLQRLQGCCRDHALLCVGVLRSARIEARNRVGFAGYFTAGFHHDHVVVEVREGERWRRFDPELEPGFTGAAGDIADPTDLAVGEGAPFQTAAEVYRRYRRGDLDPSAYGVADGSPVTGDWFIEGEVIYELAHRYGDELLLWDTWGAMPPPGAAGDPDRLALLDRVAALLVGADAGDHGAEAELYALYRTDDRLHPGSEVIRISPLTGEAVREALT